MNCFTRVAAATALVLLAPALAARPLTVGADSSCTHHSLAAAIDAASASGQPVDIRVARNAVHALAHAPVLPSNVRLRGGYSSCSDETALGHTTVTVESRAVGAGLAASAQLERIELEASDTAIAGR